MIEAATLLARINRNTSAILRPGQDQRQHGPGVVGLPHRFERQPVAPVLEFAASLARGERLEREVAEVPFDNLDLADVVSAGALAASKELLAALVAVDQALQLALRSGYALRDRCVVVRHELWRAILAVDARTVLPSVPINLGRAVGQLGERPVNALNLDSHAPSSFAIAPIRCPQSGPLYHPLLGRVDGFDQDEAESKRDERAVILRRLLASKRDTLEALELADRLFYACPCFV